MDSVPAQADVINVVIDNLVFSPEEIKAKVGDTITWNNKDIVAHTATVRGGFDVMIEANKSASLVLTKPGAVDYYCRFHPNMKHGILSSGETCWRNDNGSYWPATVLHRGSEAS
jgi:plastocyanin